MYLYMTKINCTESSFEALKESSHLFSRSSDTILRDSHSGRMPCHINQIYSPAVK